MYPELKFEYPDYPTMILQSPQKNVGYPFVPLENELFEEQAMRFTSDLLGMTVGYQMEMTCESFVEWIKEDTTILIYFGDVADLRTTLQHVGQVVTMDKMRNDDRTMELFYINDEKCTEALKMSPNTLAMFLPGRTEPFKLLEQQDRSVYSVKGWLNSSIVQHEMKWSNRARLAIKEHMRSGIVLIVNDTGAQDWHHALMKDAQTQIGTLSIDTLPIMTTLSQEGSITDSFSDLKDLLDVELPAIFMVTGDTAVRLPDELDDPSAITASILLLWHRSQELSVKLPQLKENIAELKANSENTYGDDEGLAIIGQLEQRLKDMKGELTQVKKMLAEHVAATKEPSADL